MIRHRTRPLLCTFFCLFLIPSGLAGNGQREDRPGFCEKMKPCNLLVQSDAEKLLGQPARLTKNTSELRGDVQQCQCAYIGLSRDQDTEQDCALYFSVEQN